MKLNRTASRLVFVALCVAATACRQTPAPATENAPPPTALAAQATPTLAPTATAAVVSAAPGEFNKVLTGTLGDKLHVRMELQRKGNRLTGSYAYQKPGASNVAENTLMLAGKIDKDGNVTLTETASSGDSDGQKTGAFKGVLDSITQDGEPVVRLLGTWTNARNKQSLSVALQELRYDLGGFQFGEQPLHEQNKKLRLEISALIPQLTGGDGARGTAFNKAARAALTSKLAAFTHEAAEALKDEQQQARESQPADGATTTKPADLPAHSFDGGYEVVYASPDLVSVQFNYSTYLGGAHPNHFSLAFNYDLKRSTEIKLPELFTPQANYLKVLSDYCVKELKKLSTTQGVEEGAGPKPDNYHSWNVTPLGLRFTFDPYQVGAYAVGAHEVLVPYAVLKPVLKADGLLAGFLK